MLIAALRDLQWRKRRFVIAIVGTGLVFAMTLVLTGLANGFFRVEATRTVDALGFGSYLVKTGAPGPFLGSSPFPAAQLQQVAKIRGPHRRGAAGLWQRYHARRRIGPQCQRVRRVAARPGNAADGVRPGADPAYEMAVSSTMNRPVGARVEIGSKTMEVVGIVDDSTALAGQPNIFLTVEGAQQLLFSGQQLLSSIGMNGTPASIPSGFRTVDRAGAVEDLSRALKGARQAMTLMAGLLWVVAALIVGSMIYVSAIERTRDFAVFSRPSEYRHVRSSAASPCRR